jgi:flagellar basal body rod protein FlgC
MYLPGHGKKTGCVLNCLEAGPVMSINITMNAASSIARSGMNVAQLRLDASAHNIANQQTDRFRRQEVAQAATAEGGVQASIRPAAVPGEALAQDLVQQMTAGYSFVANLKVIETEKKMMGALLNERA